MKAITIWQPYASLVECRLKKYETRSWKTSYRGPILIHSGQRPMRWILKHSREDALDVAIEQFGIDQLMQLPVGRAICVVDLVDCIEMTPEFIAAQSQAELAVGDWEPGRYAWKLENPRSVERVELIGKQGLWNVENALIRNIRKDSNITSSKSSRSAENKKFFSVGSSEKKKRLRCWRAQKTRRLKKFFSGHFVSRGPAERRQPCRTNRRPQQSRTSSTARSSRSCSA